jgi:hypothetical protein
VDGSSISQIGSEIRLDAVIVAVSDQMPRVLTVRGGVPSLPSVDLTPDQRTLELALRRGIQDQTGLAVGYVEQLYTFGDLGRIPELEGRLISIAYLALMREDQPSGGAAWTGCYSLFPWEDHRGGVPRSISEEIAPALDDWVDAAPESERDGRRLRADVVFGLNGPPWDGVRVLDRYELLYEAGVLAGSSSLASGTFDSADVVGELSVGIMSTRMALDHRRIVASALERLRGKLTYRPTVFELLAERFTLLQLQQLVEALAGVPLHKQNFRRLVEQGGLVEGTGETVATAGRPAELFTFRKEVVTERPRPGVGTPWSRT